MRVIMVMLVAVLVGMLMLMFVFVTMVRMGMSMLHAACLYVLVRMFMLEVNVKLYSFDG